MAGQLSYAAETAAYVGLNPQELSPEEEGLLPVGAHEALYVRVRGLSP